MRTKNHEITAYNQPPIPDEGKVDIVTNDGIVAEITPSEVERFEGGVAPVITFMGSVAIEDAKYNITTGIQTQSGDNENVTHMVLRKLK